MLLVADWDLTLHGILHPPGEPFDEPDEKVVRDLLDRRIVRVYDPPKVVHEFSKPKFDIAVPPVETPEVSARPPFCDVPLPNVDERGTEPDTLAAESDPVLPKTDLSASGNADRGGRNGRSRRSSGRSGNKAGSH